MNSSSAVGIKKCRICGNLKLVKIGSLGKSSLSQFTKIPKQGKKYPLELVYCRNCSLLQLAHTVPRNLLYKHYWYQSHINPVIVQDLKEIAGLCCGVHIDIGANDGTLLKYSKAKTKIAVDPSDIKPDGFYWIQDYFEKVTTQPADIITAIACLYDLPDPNAFIRNITRHLKADGVFIAQLMTLQPFIENNDVGNICHEHLLYYSYKSLVRLFEQNGLEIYKVEKNTINGGSYRIFARHCRNGSIDFGERTYGTTALKAFFKRIEKNKQKMVSFMKTHPVVGYGASTKMGTIVQYYGTSPKLIVDINPYKIGTYTVSGARVIGKIPEGTQYLWVFPYGFLEYFKTMEKNYKGNWVTTIPEFRVI